MSKLPDAVETAKRIKKEFNEHRILLKLYFENILQTELFMDQFNDKQLKLINKLLNFPGDISPTMLVKLSEIMKSIEDKN